MKILVTGSRDWTDHIVIEQALDAFFSQSLGDDDELIQGGVLGADFYARRWADRHKNFVKSTTVEADWKKWGKAAGPIRNEQMVKMVNPTSDVVLAFILNNSKGAIGCTRLAARYGFEYGTNLIVTRYDQPDYRTLARSLHQG